MPTISSWTSLPLSSSLYLHFILCVGRRCVGFQGQMVQQLNSQSEESNVNWKVMSYILSGSYIPAMLSDDEVLSFLQGTLWELSLSLRFPGCNY